MDVHAVALFLFAQVYVRRHHLSSQQPALDVWPGGHASEAAALDPSSPGRQRTNHTGALLNQLPSLGKSPMDLSVRASHRRGVVTWSSRTRSAPIINV